MVTIKDVAKRAGVSFKTVSRVLNNDAAVRDSTRQKVLFAIDELGYRPNVLARGMRTQRTYTLGFISDEIGTSPFAGKMLQGALDYAWEKDILLLSVNTNRDPKLKQKAVETLLERQVDGIVYAAMYHRNVTPPAALRSVPAVLLDCFVEDGSVPSVVPNETLGGYTATHYLLQRGYTRIAMINHNVDQPAAIGRYAGYRGALDDAGVDFNPAWLVRDISRMDGGYRATKRLIETAPEIDAIFCFNDRMAMGAYQALNEHQIKIPDDIAIIGFDNEPGFAEFFRPPLTTLQLPHYEMGRWATSQLLGMIAEPKQELAEDDFNTLWTCELVERDSC